MNLTSFVTYAFLLELVVAIVASLPHPVSNLHNDESKKLSQAFEADVTTTVSLPDENPNSFWEKLKEKVKISTDYMQSLGDEIKIEAEQSLDKIANEAKESFEDFKENIIELWHLWKDLSNSKLQVSLVKMAKSLYDEDLPSFLKHADQWFETLPRDDKELIVNYVKLQANKYEDEHMQHFLSSYAGFLEKRKNDETNDSLTKWLDDLIVNNLEGTKNPMIIEGAKLIKYIHNHLFVKNFIKLSTDPAFESYLSFFMTLLESIPEQQ